jgi:hypothetical protein
LPHTNYTFSEISILDTNNVYNDKIYSNVIFTETGAEIPALQTEYSSLMRFQAINRGIPSEAILITEKPVKNTIEERDQSIASLAKQIQGLENDVKYKNLMIAMKDSVIGTQYKTIVTAFYITGDRDQLTKMGIIKKEGGFLWGVLGATTTLASGFSDQSFQPVDKTAEATIDVTERSKR